MAIFQSLIRREEADLTDEYVNSYLWILTIFQPEVWDGQNKTKQKHVYFKFSSDKESDLLDQTSRSSFRKEGLSTTATSSRDICFCIFLLFIIQQSSMGWYSVRITTIVLLSQFESLNSTPTLDNCLTPVQCWPDVGCWLAGYLPLRWRVTGWPWLARLIASQESPGAAALKY